MSSSITSLLDFYRDLILYVCVCICGRHVCIHANGGQKRGVDPLELDLQAVLSHLMHVLGTELGSSGAWSSLFHLAGEPWRSVSCLPQELEMYSVPALASWLFDVVSGGGEGMDSGSHTYMAWTLPTEPFL